LTHTLADDPIVYPGKPGEAMAHDFFANSSTNANSTYESLSTNKNTNCDSIADRSAYWVPQLKRASGIIKPTFEKTYYKDDQPVASFPVHAIPLGLQMLAGNHMGTVPNPHINFICLGTSNFTTTMPTSCPPNSASTGDPSELHISVHFPDCWDGKTLKPFHGSGRGNRMNSLMRAANGGLNVAYRNSDGTCPVDYPVKIPELQLNVAYPSTNWGDGANLPTASACSTQSIGGIYLDNVQQVRINDISSYIASQKTAGATQIAICIRNATGKTFQFSSREGSWAPGLYLK
jgi:hypothetical protein